MCISSQKRPAKRWASTRGVLRARWRHHLAAMSSPSISAFCVLCTLLASASQEGHSGVKNATEVSKGMERLPIEERRESLGLLRLGKRDTSKVHRVVKRLCPIATLRQTPEKPFQQTFAKKGRSLIALMWLCSCQHSGEAKMMMMMTALHLRTTRSHLPQLSSLRWKPLSVSISALVCWYPSIGRNSNYCLSANLLLFHFPQDCLWGFFVFSERSLLELGYQFTSTA